MEFIDSEADMQTFYEVIAVNTAGLESSPAQLATIKVK
jgi:hypothetical protein